MTLHAPIDALPSPAARPRITMAEVCAIAMVGRLTIQRRVKAKKFPDPIDRGRESIFDRKAVYDALGIVQAAADHDTAGGLDPWLQAAHALADGRNA